MQNVTDRLKDFKSYRNGDFDTTFVWLVSKAAGRHSIAFWIKDIVSRTLNTDLAHQGTRQRVSIVSVGIAVSVTANSSASVIGHDTDSLATKDLLRLPY